MERQEPGRREMGREAFLKRVWEWKAESGGTIVNQLKRLGASCDWSRERFTMDEGLSKAVLKVFVELVSRRADLQGQAAGQLGPEAADRDFRSRSRAGRGQGPDVALPLSDRGQDLQRGRPVDIHLHRHDAAGDHAGRRRGRRAAGRRALQASDRQTGAAAAGQSSDPDHRRRISRSGKGLGRGEDHARRTTSTISKSGRAIATRIISRSSSMAA